MKQTKLAGFFQKASAKPVSPLVRSTPQEFVSNPPSSDRDILSVVESDDEDQGPVKLSGRKSAKRKSVIAQISSSDEEKENQETSLATKSKKPRYSCASSPSGASSSKSRNGMASSRASSTGGHSENETDEADEDDESTAFLPSLKAAKGARKNKKAETLMTTAERLKAMNKSEAQEKQAPWEFLRQIRDADKNPVGHPEYDPGTLYISKKDWESMTPFEVQFWEIKQKHFDTVLFFQKGKFSELYEGDAMIGHREFDLKITKRVKMSMVGVPESSVGFWMAKFIAKGYKVGKVDQCETALGAEMRNKGSLPTAKSGKAPPKPKTAAKEVVRRELRSVISSGTIVDGSLLTDDTAACLLAIKETVAPSGVPAIGVIIMDAATAEFNLAHFEDSNNRTHLETIMCRYRPKEILHEKSGLSPSTLRVLRNTAVSDCTWSILKSDQFSDVDDCVFRLTELYEESGGQIPEVIKSFYDRPETIQALGGLLCYLEQSNLDKQLVTCKNMKILDAFRPSKTLQLDGKTISDLELLQNDTNEESPLLKLLNRCMTPFGKRLFRHWLCTPLQEASEINTRLDAVDHLMNSSSFEQAFSTFKGLPDLERIISRIHAGACTVPNFLKVLKAYRKCDENLKELRDLIQPGSASVLDNLLQSLPDAEALLEGIEAMFTLNEEGKELQPLEGKDELYDLALKEEEDAEKALKAELKAAKKLLKTDDIVYKDIGIKDIYQIQVPAKIKVPLNWVKMSGTKDCARYYSPQSAQLVKNLKQAREKKTCALKDFHLKVFAVFDKDYLVWLRIVKIIAELDCLLSLAKASAAMGEPACRPDIVESPVATIKFGSLRHPCTMGRDDHFVSNDVVVGGDESRMILLTGPNMAGKSTLLRMACVAVVLAQIGCYVPAESAQISPVDRICTRMGASDHIFAHASTFKVEMDDARKILMEATSKSLVILDELGRGTSTFDGHAIAFAVLHRLATHSNCLGFFATHYSALTEDYKSHANVSTKFMLTEVDDVTREVVFLYKLASGVSPRSYGPHVAKMAGIPSEIVERATSISEKFEAESKEKQMKTRATHRLDLITQADTAYLIRILKHGLEQEKGSTQEKLRTLERIKSGIQSCLQQKPVKR